MIARLIRTYSLRLIIGGFFTTLALTASTSKTICTIVADARTGQIISEQGRCTERVTPASTFKIALGLMAYDSGFLKDEHHPTLPFQKGYVEWGGDNWKQPIDAIRWFKYSVVWFSQQITHALGEQKLRDYAAAFKYGNADFSGDQGQHNGLDRAWISSSLRITPLEQIAFLGKLAQRQLPVSDHALNMILKVVEDFTLADGSRIQGKTGMAYPRTTEGKIDKEHPWGWFVGWTADRSFVFVRLIQDDAKMAGSAGLRARDGLMEDLPAILKIRR